MIPWHYLLQSVAAGFIVGIPAAIVVGLLTWWLT